MTIRGHIRNGVAVLDDAHALPDGTPVTVHVEAPAFSFHDNLPIEVLAQQQGIVRPPSLEDLAGDWPPEDDIEEFLSAVTEARA
jgi:hypothetical protein